VTLITEEVSLFGPGRTAPVDSGFRRGKSGKKGTSAFSAAFDADLEPVAQSVTLPAINPARHARAFRRAMDLVEESGSE
jgi:hypothetical protein